MKIKTKQYAIWAGLLLCTSLGASAVPVTFQVDMGYQTAFDPAANSVEVRGAWNWGGTGLTNVPGTTIYTNTIEITATAGSWVQYKFFVGYNGTLNWEQLGGWHPGGNRVFKVPTAAQTLPLAYYADAGPGGTAVPVTFQIDMSAQAGAGFFNPAAGDLIQTMGAFNNAWNAVVLTNDPAGTNPNLYSGTYEETTRPPGSLIEYKFAINVGALGPLSYETLSAYLYPDSPPNRALILPTSALTLPPVYFSDTAGYPIEAAVLFQLDLSSQILVGNFDPAIDQAWVRGGAMGWDAPPSGFQLFEDTSRPGIYTNLFKLAAQLTGAPVEYKYTIWHTATAGTVWEDGDNKSVTFTGTEPVDAEGYHTITLAPTWFNNFRANPSDYLPADTWVTFTIDMTAAVGVTNNNETYGGIDWNDGLPHSVYVNGPFVNYNGVRNAWWAWAQTPVDVQVEPLVSTLARYQLTNNPIGSQIYSLQVLLPKGSPVRVQYKYSIDGYDNEAGSFQDRFRDVRTLGLPNYAFPQDTFGVQWGELIYDPQDFGRLAIGGAAGGTVPVSWLGRPGVHLQTTTTLGGTWTDLNNTDGTTWTAGTSSPDGLVSVTNYPTSAGATFFRLIKPGP